MNHGKEKSREKSHALGDLEDEISLARCPPPSPKRVTKTAKGPAKKTGKSNELKRRSQLQQKRTTANEGTPKTSSQKSSVTAENSPKFPVGPILIIAILFVLVTFPIFFDSGADKSTTFTSKQSPVTHPKPKVTQKNSRQPDYRPSVSPVNPKSDSAISSFPTELPGKSLANKAPPEVVPEHSVAIKSNISSQPPTDPSKGNGSDLEEKALRKVRSIMGSDVEQVGRPELSIRDKRTIMRGNFEYFHQGRIVESIWEITFQSKTNELLSARQKEVKDTESVNDVELGQKGGQKEGQEGVIRLGGEAVNSKSSDFRPYGLRSWTFSNGRQFRARYVKVYLSGSAKLVVVLKSSEEKSSAFLVEQLSNRDQEFVVRAYGFDDRR